MTIKELTKELQRFDGHEEVIMATDLEGNGFWQIDEVSYLRDTKGIFHLVVWPNDTVVFVD